MTKPLRLLTLAALFSLAPAASAQVGVGGLVGDPLGLTFKLGVGRGAVAIDVNLDDAIYGQLHYLIREQRFGSGADVRFLFGPGILVGEGADDAVIGLSALLGVSWYADRQFEIFGQLTPRVILTPDTDGDVAAAVGVRFYP